MTPDDEKRESSPEQDGRVAIARFRRLKTANEYGLVILSMKLPYWLLEEDGYYVLYVPSKYEIQAREQIERYRGESRYWPPVEQTDLMLDVSSLSIWAYVLILSAFFYVTHGSVEAREQWFALGRVDAGRILEAGEWYRVATALTLHSDIGHLAGNIAAGALFAYFLIRVLGSGFGWILILLAGLLGNAVNVLAHGERGHLSVGASTAVFGALGLIVGYQLIREFRGSGWRWPRRIWIPLGGGLILLGFLGAGGERTDVLAHLWGFLAGIVLVVPFAWKPSPWVHSIKAQLACGVTTLLLIVVAWLAAFGAET